MAHSDPCRELVNARGSRAVPSRRSAPRFQYLVVGHERSEQLSAAGNGTTVCHRDLRVRDALGHGRGLALAHFVDRNDLG